MRILVFHRQRSHFEVLLSLVDNLRHIGAVFVWSDSLNVFDRAQLLRNLNVDIHKLGNEYDVVCMVNGDLGESSFDHSVDLELKELLARVPIVRVMHRWSGEDKPGLIYLFPRSQQSFLPVSTGLEHLRSPKKRDRQRKTTFLIQGNMENRRNYDIVPELAAELPHCQFNLIGLKVNVALRGTHNIAIRANLSEIDFHLACANSDYILPLVDPTHYGQYFKDRITSSFQIGMSYTLPFVARSELFSHLPIAGVPYMTTMDFIDALKMVANCDEAHYATWQTELEEVKIRIREKNIDTFYKAVAQSRILRGGKTSS